MRAAGRSAATGQSDAPINAAMLPSPPTSHHASRVSRCPEPRLASVRTRRTVCTVSAIAMESATNNASCRTGSAHRMTRAATTIRAIVIAAVTATAAVSVGRTRTKTIGRKAIPNSPPIASATKSARVSQRTVFAPAGASAGRRRPSLTSTRSSTA